MNRHRMSQEIVDQIDRVAALEARVNVCKTFGLIDLAQKASVEKDCAVKRLQSLRQAAYPRTQGMVVGGEDHE